MFWDSSQIYSVWIVQFELLLLLWVDSGWCRIGCWLMHWYCSFLTFLRIVDILSKPYVCELRWSCLIRWSATATTPNTVQAFESAHIFFVLFAFIHGQVVLDILLWHLILLLYVTHKQLLVVLIWSYVIRLLPCVTRYFLAILTVLLEVSYLEHLLLLLAPFVFKLSPLLFIESPNLINPFLSLLPKSPLFVT